MQHLLLHTLCECAFVIQLKELVQQTRTVLTAISACFAFKPPVPLWVGRSANDYFDYDDTVI